MYPIANKSLPEKSQGRKNERIFYKLKVFNRFFKREKNVKYTTKNVSYICIK